MLGNTYIKDAKALEVVSVGFVDQNTADERSGPDLLTFLQLLTNKNSDFLPEVFETDISNMDEYCLNNYL